MLFSVYGFSEIGGSLITVGAVVVEVVVVVVVEVAVEVMMISSAVYVDLVATSLVVV